MAKLLKLFSFGPQSAATQQIQINVNLLRDTDLAHPIVRFNRMIRSFRENLLGSAHAKIERLPITELDILWILLHLFLNIRFIVNFIDLCLEWGGLLVWTTYSITSLTLGTWQCIIYTFLGAYGDRSYLLLWDIMPLFSGISHSVTLVELLKLLEVGFIVTSGTMSFTDHFFYTLEPNPVPFGCNASRYEFEPATAISYGMSETFTLYGNTPNVGANISRLWWSLSARRCNQMILVYFFIILIKFVGYRNYRHVLMQSNFYMMFIHVGLILILSATVIRQPLVKVGQFDISTYTNVQAYLNTIACVISDFMPMYLVTLGFLRPQGRFSEKIWMAIIIRIIVSFCIFYIIPFVAADLYRFANVERIECLRFFGLHFVFVMVPITLKSYLLGPLVPIMSISYFTMLIVSGIMYIVISMELFLSSFVTWRPGIYRYRNLTGIIILLCIMGLSMLMSIQNVHYFIFFMNFKVHYFLVPTITILTMVALGVYGLDRINGDHLLMRSVICPFIQQLKFMFLFIFTITLLFFTQALFYNYRLGDNSVIYWVFIGICLMPLLWGVINTYTHQHKYHGLLQPSTKWGMPLNFQRNIRRRTTYHTMYTYRMKKNCFHNCLHSSEIYKNRLEENLDELERVIGIKKADKLRVLIDRPSYVEENSQTVINFFN